MTDQTDKPIQTPSLSILGRFGHLLSAQGVEALGSTLFFLYLAWIDAASYGTVMYALAAGSLVNKIIQFGLYYPLVSDLGQADPSEAPMLLGRVNLVKLGLLLPTMLGVIGLALYRQMSFEMAWVLFFVCLGFALEAIAETFFAHFRVKGRQDREARIKMVASFLSYGFGFLAALAGLDPLIIGLFKMISGSIRLVFSAWGYLSASVLNLLSLLELRSLWLVFKAAGIFALIEILGIIYNKTNIFFLESQAGVKGLAYYSATWNLVDPVSILASQQLLGWVIFPLLAALWTTDLKRATFLVRSNALWLMAVALPIMFILAAESELIIGLVYPDEYRDAVWMQKYLVWTILLSFENNLFNYVMMVAGAARVLFIFAAMTTCLNLAYNFMLVEPLGLAGGCLVIILTKATMTLATFLYCQTRFKLFKLEDMVFPIVSAGLSLGVFWGLDQVIGRHAAVAGTLLVYAVLIKQFGVRFYGASPKKKTAPSEVDKDNGVS